MIARSALSGVTNAFRLRVWLGLLVPRLPRGGRGPRHQCLSAESLVRTKIETIVTTSAITESPMPFG